MTVSFKRKKNLGNCFSALTGFVISATEGLANDVIEWAEGFSALTGFVISATVWLSPTPSEAIDGRTVSFSALTGFVISATAMSEIKNAVMVRFQCLNRLCDFCDPRTGNISLTFVHGFSALTGFVISATPHVVRTP